MKSEKKFLEEIYEKAKQSTNQSDYQNRITKHKTWYQAASLIAAAMLVVILIPVGMYSRNKNKEVPDYSNQISRSSYTALTVFDGCIQKVSENQNSTELEVLVKHSYEGESSGIVKVSYDQNDSEVTYTFTVGEQALFYVEPGIDGYVIRDQQYGKCKWVGEEDGWPIYEAPSGKLIYSKELM